jgi:hypothetical protein
MENLYSIRIETLTMIRLLQLWKVLNNAHD